MISIICPIYNEEKYIEKCIDSILEQDYSKDELEVIFIDGMSTDNTRSIVSNYCEDYPYIMLLDNPDRIVPPALNIGISKAQGDYIIRIDAHCIYPSNYISTLVKYAVELNSDNIGAVCRTLPADNSTKSIAIALGMGHRFGVGDSTFRVGARDIQEVDTVPFGCFKRSIFDKVGLFDEELIRNQDDEFNGRIIKNGGKIYLIPQLMIDYFARNSISKLGKMFYQYGLFKPLVNKKLGSPATLRQFFPLLFLLGICFGALSSVYSPTLRVIYLSIIVLYIILSLFFGIKLALQYKKMRLILYMPVVFLMMHLSYGYGYLCGILKIILKKNFVVQSSR